MIALRRKRLVLIAIAGLLGLWLFTQADRLQAQTSLPQVEDFESDPFPYTPTADPIHDPNLTGLPPAGWKDQRNGGAGIVQSVPSGFLGIPTSPSGGSSYGIIYPADPQPGPVYTNAPYSTPAYSIAPLGQTWSFRTDIYTDGSILPANNGIPDFWWTNAVNNASGVGTVDSTPYLTETGFTGTVQPDGQWRFTTTKGGQPSIDLAPNSWYTLEVSYDTSKPQLAGDLKIYNQAHTALLYSYSLSTLFPETTPPQSADMGGPRYSWFTYFNKNMTHLAVDNVGVDTPLSLVSSDVVGDMNGDGVLDAADITQFQSALSNLSATQGTIPMGDVNGDGKFNYFDIAAFQQLETSSSSSFVAGGSNFDISAFEPALIAGPATAVPEPSTFALLGIAGLMGLLSAAHRRTGRSIA